jgi:hypothetical protein
LIVCISRKYFSAQFNEIASVGLSWFAIIQIINIFAAECFAMNYYIHVKIRASSKWHSFSPGQISKSSDL